MKILAFIEATVFDRDGKVISHKKKPSRSFVRGFNHILCAQIRQESTPDPVIPTKNTGGALVNLRNSSACLRADGPVGIDDYGIVVGTSNQAVDIEDYALIAAVAEGVGAGQMNHQAGSATYLGVAAGVSSFTVDRSILNNSGDTINIEEVGIYVTATRTPTIATYVMVMRDLVSQAVPDGGGITVTYTIRIAA